MEKMEIEKFEKNLCVGEAYDLIHVLVGHSIRQTAERWQHSYSTISKVVHEVADIFDSLGHLLQGVPK